MNLQFDANINIFYGANGQGKTNIVEGIYFLSNTSSFRTAYFKEMINYSEDEAIVFGELNRNKRKEKYKIITKKNGKALFYNDISQNKTSDYIGKFNAVCFSPVDVSIFKDSPGVRRLFLDKELSALFPIYVKELIAFSKALEKRNDSLKMKNVDMTLIEILTNKIIEASYEVSKRRNWLINKLNEYATKIYESITKTTNVIKIDYLTFVKENDKAKYLQTAKSIYDKYIEKDKEKTFTNMGIHKDDFKVYLNGHEIDMYASQGQQRLISLCIKLAVVEIMARACNDYPIIILDDAFSELDTNKKARLFEYICSFEQVFITCTDYKQIITNNPSSRICLHKVKDGKIIERSFI